MKILIIRVLLINILLISSCNQDIKEKVNESQDKSNVKCSDCSSLYLHQINSYYNDRLDSAILLKEDSNQIRKTVLEITNPLDSLSKALIDITGGVSVNPKDQKVVCIAYPCSKGILVIEMFKKVNIVRRIKAKLDLINGLKQVNEKDKILVKYVTAYCNYFLLSDNSYINEESLKNKEYALTILDISILENALYSILIMDS